MTLNVRALRDVVLFTFLDETVGTKGRFDDRVLPSGIVLAPVASRQKMARWGKIYSVGPEIHEDDLKVGQYILIEPLMWTEGVKLEDGTKVWKTDPSKIMLVTDDVEAAEVQ